MSEMCETKIYKCDICDKEFNDKYIMKQHQKISTQYQRRSTVTFVTNCSILKEIEIYTKLQSIQALRPSYV